MSDTIDTRVTVFQRYNQEILQELHRVFFMPHISLLEGVNDDALLNLEGQMKYHLTTLLKLTDLEGLAGSCPMQRRDRRRQKSFAAC